MRSPLRAALPLVSMLLAACSAAPADDAAVTGEAPLVGVDGAKDSGDTGCNVVLRSMERVSNNTGGYLTHDNYSWIWRGSIDVSTAAVAEGSVPAVLYQYGSDPTWRSVDAVKVGDVAGFSRYSADLWDGMPSSGMSGTSLSRVDIQVIPYLKLTQGGRLFDHNRVHDPNAAYHLTGQSGMVVPEDASVCSAPPPAPAPVSDGPTLSFKLDGSVSQSGPLSASSHVTIAYDIDRLTTCRGTHNGYPAWDLLAHVRFSPSQAEVGASVRQLGSNLGVPTNQAVSAPFAFDVPAGTTRVDVWFENYTGAGSSCRAWDSNNGQNYSFDVQKAVGWIGNATANFTRSATGPCDGGAPLGQGFNYGTWTRQRAALRNVCFEVWQAGTTDRTNPDLWRQIAVEVHYRFAPTAAWNKAYVNFESRVGNNARYAWDLSPIDPFAPYRCPNVPYSRTADGQYDEAQMEFYFTANGVPLTQPGGASFSGAFDDYPGAPHPCP